MNTRTPSESLAADTSMGPVSLLVADLDLMTSYYRDSIGLDVLETAGPRVSLGRAHTPTGPMPVVELTHSPALRHASPGQAGLYHTAIVFDDEPGLAAAVLAAARDKRGHFTGSADHLASKAFYFDDPEGNGVELYWDRDRKDWTWIDGQLQMGIEALDPNAYLSEHLTDAGALGPLAGTAARVGHVHLSVGSVAAAQEFYVDRLGFDITVAMPTALFVSAGGYHHHMAMNVWKSRGAGPRQATLGLGSLDIVLPDAAELGRVTERMAHFGHLGEDDGRTVSYRDPWDNLVRLTAVSPQNP